MAILLRGNRVLHVIAEFVETIRQNSIYRGVLAIILFTFAVMLCIIFYFENKTSCIGNYCGKIKHSPLLINNPFELSRQNMKQKDKLAYLSHEVLFDGVMVQMYEPLHATWLDPYKRPATVMIHGGGWLNKEPGIRLEQPLIREILGHSIIFSIDYSSAVDSPFPAAYDECLRATRFLLKKHEDYKLDKNKIILFGGNTGGNIAAAVALAIGGDPTIPHIRAQVLMNPPLQALDFNTPSYMQNDSLSGLERGNMINFWSYYARGEWDTTTAMKFNRHVPQEIRAKYSHVLNHHLIPEEYMITSVHYQKAIENQGPPEMTAEESQLWDSIQSTYLNPHFAPLMAEKFSDFPETIIYVGFHDILRDDSIFFDNQLRSAGVKCSLYIDPEGFHGAFWYRASEVGLQEELISIYDKQESKFFPFI